MTERLEQGGPEDSCSESWMGSVDSEKILDIRSRQVVSRDSFQNSVKDKTNGRMEITNNEEEKEHKDQKKKMRIYSSREAFLSTIVQNSSSAARRRRISLLMSQKPFVGFYGKKVERKGTKAKKKKERKKGRKTRKSQIIQREENKTGRVGMTAQACLHLCQKIDPERCEELLLCRRGFQVIDEGSCPCSSQDITDDLMIQLPSFGLDNDGWEGGTEISQKFIQNEGMKG